MGFLGVISEIAVKSMNGNEIYPEKCRSDSDRNQGASAYPKLYCIISGLINNFEYTTFQFKKQDWCLGFRFLRAWGLSN